MVLFSSSYKESQRYVEVQIQFLPAALRHGLTEGRMVGGGRRLGHFGPVGTFTDFQMISHVKKFNVFRKFQIFRKFLASDL